MREPTTIYGIQGAIFREEKRMAEIERMSKIAKRRAIIEAIKSTLGRIKWNIF